LALRRQRQLLALGSARGYLGKPPGRQASGLAVRRPDGLLKVDRSADAFKNLFGFVCLISVYTSQHRLGSVVD